MSDTRQFTPARRQALQWGVGALCSAWPLASGAAAERAELRLGGGQLVTLAVPQVASPSHLPLTLAYELGFLRQEGLQVDWLPVESDAAATQALSRGRADAVSCDFTHALHSQVRGLELQAVAVQMRAPQVVFGLLPRASVSVRAAQDLKGRRVGMQSAVVERLVALRLLHTGGLHEGDVSWAHFADPSDMLEQLRAGLVDGFCLDHALVSGLEQKGEVRVLADTRSVRGTQDVFGGPVPGVVVAAPVAFVRQRPEACQALVNGVVRALKWLRTAGPSDLFRVLPEPASGSDRAHFLAAFEKARDGLAVDAVMEPLAAANAAAALAQMDERLRHLPLRAAYSYVNDFAQRAKQRFRA